MPRTKKPAGLAADPRNGRRTELAVATPQRFDPPADLCSEARQQWDVYWESPVASAVLDADRFVLLRWIEALNRYILTIKIADTEPISTGSTGQSTPSPFYKIAEQALATVERCEKQLGLGAANRAALGLAIGSERKLLSDLNERYREVSSVDSDEASQDPRLIVAVADSSRLVS